MASSQNGHAGVDDVSGAAEALRCWSRRIDEEHRPVYLVDGSDLVVLQARYRYES